MENKKDKSKHTEEESKKTESSEDKNSPETKMIDMQKQVDDCRDKLLRKAAEFENYKRRTENELSNLITYANERIIVELLQVLDDYDRMNTAWDENHDVESLKKGSDLIYEKLFKILTKNGLEQIDAIGKKFDVNLHDAVMQLARTDVEPDTVVNEAEKGYKLNGKVIRHAKVVVSTHATGD